MTVRSFAAILLAGGSMCISMRAAQEIRFINFPGSEMELIPGFSPEFTQLMTGFAEPDTLSTRSASDRSTYLKAVIDNPDAQNADATSELGARHRTANTMMLHVMTAKDDEALFRRSLENIIYNDAHELHRRQQ